MTKTAAPILVISTEAKRSGRNPMPLMTEKPTRALRHFDRCGVEKSPSWYEQHYGGRSLDSEYH